MQKVFSIGQHLCKPNVVVSMKSHSVLQEMLYGPLFLAALFCCMFSKSKAYATDVKIVNLKQGGNAELKLPQRQLHLNSFTVCSSVFPIYSARLSFPILTMNIHNESLILLAHSVISYGGRWVIGVEIYKGGRPIINGAANSIVFPLQWVTFCLSMDLVSGTLRLTLDSQLAVDEAHEDFVIANTSSMPISFHLGATNDKKSSRRVSNLNMFSSAGKDETDYKGRDERMRSTWGPLELGADKFDLQWHLQPIAS